jgi:hypothetical protein
MHLLPVKNTQQRDGAMVKRWALHSAWTLLFLIAPVGSRVAEACVCDLNPPCAATWKADAVFVGTIMNQTLQPLSGPLSWTVRNVAVTQKLRGTVDASVTLVQGYRPTAEEIEAAISAGAVGSVGSSDCDYRFQLGRQYLIYARRTADGRWTTSRCDGTKPLEEAADDLDYIAGLPPAEPVGRIYGKIERTVLDSTDSAGTRRVPATGVTIALTGKSNRVTVTTDKKGKVDVQVPPDEYTIAPVVPQTVRVFGSPIQRLVPARACAPVYFSLIANGRIEGHVVQEDGTPVPRASVDVIPADLPPDQQPDSHTTAPEASTDEKGRFAVDAILPGRYVIAVNGRYGPRLHSPYAITYFPGPGRQDASVIEIGDGERKMGFTIVVKRLTETTVSGVVLFADDRPVADAFVTAAPADHARMTSSTKTDGSGLFQLRVLSGVTYVFKASARPGDGSGQTETVVFVDQQTERIRLSIRP